MHNCFLTPIFSRNGERIGRVKVKKLMGQGKDRLVRKEEGKKKAQVMQRQSLTTSN